MSIKLDKNTLEYFEKKWSINILVHFYDAGCSWTKVDITDDFKISDDLVKIESTPFNIYVKWSEKEKLENASITRVVKADHSWKEKVRYILSSEKIKDRCWCWSSFSFEKKKPKIDLEKLKSLKNNFKIWK